MADSIIITPQSQVQTVSAGGQQTQSATEAGTPQPGVPQGTIVSGTIIGKDANGNFVLKSVQGLFSVPSKVPLTYNSDVVIRVGANTTDANATRIVSVNGQPFADFAAPEPVTADSVSPSLLVQSPPAPAMPATANALPAVIVAAPAPEQQPVGAPILQSGNTVVIRLPETQAQAAQITIAQQPVPQPQPAGTPQLASPTLPAPPSAATPASPAQTSSLPQPQTTSVQQPVSPSAPSSAGVPAPPSIPVPAGTTSTPQQPANTVTVTQEQTPQNQPVQPQAATLQTEQPQSLPLTGQPQTPSAPVSALYNVYAKQSTASQPLAAVPQTPAPSAGLPPATIAAQVVSTDEHGNVNLQTPQGTVTLQATPSPVLTSLAPGTNVTIELPAAVIAQIADAEPAPLSELASSWQSLRDIVSIVAAHDQPAASALLARLPQIGPDFLSRSAGFMASLLQGDARKLLGDDTIDTLRQRGRADLVEKFSAELANLGTAFTTPGQKPVPSWQPIFLPFVYQETLQQARIYVKRDAPKKEHRGKATGDTRFVVEVDMSEFGAMQMDGFVRKKEQSTAFDLVIRSHLAFSPEDRAQMQDIYTAAAELTGFKGSLAFQVTQHFPVNPLEDAAGNEMHGSITA
jgi:hypothetical protein